MPVIGFFNGFSQGAPVAAFRKGLNEAGYAAGPNLTGNFVEASCVVRF
jgi:hypothetical protein